MAADLEDASGNLTQRLVAEQARFLAFLRRRIRDPHAAGDVLQDAYVKALEHGGELRDSESVVAWFYGILRNAMVDRARREDARARAVDRARGAALPIVEQTDGALHEAVCECVSRVLGTLTEDQSMLLRRAEIEGEPVTAIAASLGLTANHASVRLHRARRALRDRMVALCGACARHGCLSCECRTAGRAPPEPPRGTP